MRIPGVPYVQGRNDYSDSDGRKYGIAIHNTSNDATAEGEASYATRRTDGISAHLYVDQDSVVQSLDTGDRAGHAGSNNGNQHAVAVEITGVNGWTRQQWLDRVAWDKLGAALAHVVRHYGIAVRRASVTEMKANPKVKAFYSHDDMRRAWGGTSHTDPGGNFPWDRLFQAVNAALDGEDDDMLKDDKELQEALAALQHSVDVAGYRVESTVSGRLTHNNKMGNTAEPNRLTEALRALDEKLTALAATPPGAVTISDEQLERVLRRVVGSVDGATPQG